MKRLVFAAMVACGGGGSAPPATPLAATLAVHDLDVEVVIVNRGTNPIEVASQSLESASLLLQVKDATGANVPGGPPPTPRLEMTTIAPGARIERKVHLDPLSPGEYSVTVRALTPDQGPESNTAKLRVP